MSNIGEIEHDDFEIQAFTHDDERDTLVIQIQTNREYAGMRVWLNDALLHQEPAGPGSLEMALANLGAERALVETGQHNHHELHAETFGYVLERLIGLVQR